MEPAAAAAIAAAPPTGVPVVGVGVLDGFVVAVLVAARAFRSGAAALEIVTAPEVAVAVIPDETEVDAAVVLGVATDVDEPAVVPGVVVTTSDELIEDTAADESAGEESEDVAAEELSAEESETVDGGAVGSAMTGRAKATDATVAARPTPTPQ